MTAEPSAWDGCQVHHCFVVDDLRLDRLESAWLSLLRDVPQLRGTVDPGGRWSAARRPPGSCTIPVLTATTSEAATLLRERLAEEMAGRALRPGRGPHHRVAVTRGPDDDHVHLLTDLTLLDGRSIHLLVRELSLIHISEPTRRS